MLRLSRPKIGLALGSGGPRGLAHIGVIQVLVQNNIPIDYIAGSSIGAMVGGFFAATGDIQLVEKIALETDWKLILSLIDPTFSQGLLNGNKVTEFIAGYLGSIQFNDLKTPLSVVATDIQNGDTVVINSGEVTQAIRASISLPLVFKPVERDDRLLSDGGLSLPVPVSLVREMGADRIIAVNLDADYFPDEPVSRSKLGLREITVNTVNILRHHLSLCNVEHADVVLNPSVGGARWDQFVNGREIIEAGKDAAFAQLPLLKKLLR